MHRLITWSTWVEFSQFTYLPPYIQQSLFCTHEKSECLRGRFLLYPPLPLATGSSLSVLSEDLEHIREISLSKPNSGFSSWSCMHMVNIWYVLKVFLTADLPCLQLLVSDLVCSGRIYGNSRGYWNSKSSCHPKGSVKSLLILLIFSSPMSFLDPSSSCHSAMTEAALFPSERTYQFLDFSLLSLICSLRALKDFYLRFLKTVIL